MSDAYDSRVRREDPRAGGVSPQPTAPPANAFADRRRLREQRRRATRMRRRAFVLVLVLATLLVAALLWYRMPESTGASEPRLTRSSGTQSEPVMRPSEPEQQLTPYFASYKGLKLRLPVAVEALTEVGFHQASYDYALPIRSLLPDADTAAAKKKKRGTGRDLSEQESGADAVLVGKVLRMWRDRPGPPNTAIDVGAAPKTPIVAPLDGTVVLVKRYNLYNDRRYPDYQVHIRPEGRPELDLVMIHVASPKVKAGDRVMAGASPIGVVREFSDRMSLQLGHYTKGGGDHTHLQINDVTDSDYEGLKGAIDPVEP